MNHSENAIHEALYAAAVADREAVRTAVLQKAHVQMESPVKPSVRPRRRFRYAAVPVAAAAAFVVLVNGSVPFAAAVEQIPVLNAVARLVTLRTWSHADESVEIQGSQPAVENTGNAELETQLNAFIHEKLDTLDAAAQNYAREYRENWLAMGNSEADFTPIQYTFDYETYYSDENTLSFVIRQNQVITTNTSDSDVTLFYYTLDTQTGADMTLSQLLGEDWKTVVAQGVDAQIRASGDERKMSYYQEFWVDKNVPIDDSQKFYLNADGKVVAVFDQGWIAPYEDGVQEFVLE